MLSPLLAPAATQDDVKLDGMHFMKRFDEGLNPSAPGHEGFKAGFKDAIFVPDERTVPAPCYPLRAAPVPAQ